jgi:Mg2+ and Co2+ transporter CorA
LLFLVGGGGKKFPRIERGQILNAYRAGSEAVISLFEYLQDRLLTIIEEHEARIEELEAKLNKDNSSAASRVGNLGRVSSRDRETALRQWKACAHFTPATQQQWGVLRS